jgi:hypothetical protein
MSQNHLVAMSKDFLNKLNKETKSSLKKQINDTITKFQNNPMSSGLNYESINNAKNEHYRSIRVNNDVRIILLAPAQGNLYLLCQYDHHEAAYKWAENKQCKVNAKTGSIQIFTVTETVVDTVTDIGPTYTGPKLFDDYSDEQLMLVGCPEELLPQIRIIKDLSHFIKLDGGFPGEVYEALSYLASDIPIKEVLQLVAPDITEDSVVDTEDFKTALKRPQTQQSFWVAEDEHQLAKMLHAPLEQWRVFLHPTQRKLAQKSANGSMRVLGGAGTGKTVVAMHRARYLVEQVFTEPSDRVLFTTFTTNLAADIKDALKTLIKPAFRDQVEVVHLNGWVRPFLKQQDHYSYQIDFFSSSKKLKALWDEAISGCTQFSPTFLRDEWEQVIQFHGILDIKSYYKVRRTGRGSKLSKAKRYEVWQYFESYRTLLASHGLKENEDAIRDARLMLEAKPHLAQYRSIIVDEAQDLSPESYKLIRALTPKGPNDILVVGDGHQRIYRYKVSLKSCGINIVGRSARLRLNYRTTEQIRRYAVRVLENISVDDLDNELDHLKGYHSLLAGQDPTVNQFHTTQEEVAYICGMLAQNDIDPARCCVVARTQHMIDQFISELDAQGQKTIQIKRSIPTASTKLRVATMHRVKGLEFDHVFLVGLNQGVLPLPQALKEADPSDESSVERIETIERCLLYVAITRAKKTVSLTSHGLMSKLVQDIDSSSQN